MKKLQDKLTCLALRASLVVQTVKKNLPAMQETRVQTLGLIPLRREWQPTPVFLPGEFHGQRNLAGYSSWGCKQLDRTNTFTIVILSLQGWECRK